MTTARKRPTALDKARARIADLEEQLEHAQRYIGSEAMERRRLEERCAWLYQEAAALGAEVVRLRLSAGFMSPERYAQQTPNANPQTSLTRAFDFDSGHYVPEKTDGRR